MSTIRQMMPGERLDLRLDWTDELPTGTVIDASDWIVGAGLTLGTEDFTDTATRGRITFNGAKGSIYNATNRITLDDNQQDDYTVRIKGFERIVVFIKDPEAMKDFTINWQPMGIFAAGETISSVAHDVPAGLTQESEGNTSYSSIVRLSGGIEGAEYRIPLTVTTSTGQLPKCILLIRVRAQ